MNRSPLQTPKVSRGNSLNAFDLSHRNIFSNSIGILRPCCVIHTVPNEKYKINLDSFSRSQAVNTSSFMRVKENIDFFFVPYRLLWNAWDHFITQQTNYNSKYLDSTFDSNGVQSVPQFLATCFNAGGIFAPAVTDKDYLGYPRTCGIARLFNALDYGQLQPEAGGSYPGTYTLNDVLPRNPFAALAYQKIYHDHYQNDQWETPYVGTFNMDGQTVDIDNLQDMCYCFDLQYVSRRKDYKTVIKRSYVPIGSMPYVSSFNANVFENYNSTPPFNVANFNLNRGDVIKGSDLAGVPSTLTNPNVNNSVNVITSVSKQISAAAIRATLALDKLATAVGLTGKSYREQLSARYGIDIPKIRSDQSVLIGSFDSSVVISEVTATSAQDLGKIGGKGTSSLQGREITFNTGSEFGVIMGIHYFSPLSDWSSEMLDRHNIKKYFLDYFQPELDNLGYQPTFGFEVGMPYSSTAAANKTRQTVGFSPRYMEYKTKLSKVYGVEFSNRYWTSELRTNLDSSFSYLKLMKVSPSDFDSQFGIQYDGTEATDQFICNVFFHITKLSPMSVFGLPNYG